jgi:hypothetical protein
MKKLRVTLVGLLVALTVAAGAFWFHQRTQKPKFPPVAAELVSAAAQVTAGLPIRELDLQVQNGELDGARVHIGLYASGKRINDVWTVSNGVEAAVALAWQKVSEKLTQQPRVAIVSVAHGKIEVTAKNHKGLLSNTHRGVYGLMVQPAPAKTEKSEKPEKDPGPVLKSPTFFVTNNRGLRQQVEQIAKAEKTDLDQLIASRRVFVLDARQFYVDLAKGQPARELLRGNVLIRPEEVTHDSLQAFARRMSEWMLNNVQPDGREVYLFFPSRGEESKGNNTIRQWMATICLGRIAKSGQYPGAQEIADRNLRYNMKKFYRDRDGLGSIEYDGSSKLGAIALALGGIMESPLRGEFANEEAALRRTIDHLWQANGRFTTFLTLPSSAGDKEEGDDEELVGDDAGKYHNFYPGETLLSWAMTFAETRDAALEQKILTSARHYKDWHLQNRNPAFVPWHTQAYYLMWQQKQYAELKDWIFEMNDWLLGMQERSMVEYEDTLGRFYDPKNPQYGGPHASSTGVYLEGLIDAFALAREVGDQKRVQKYRRAILLGLRDAMQLEFGDEVDWFYVTKPERVRGGLRVAVYDNQIRVDNVQHVLMGLQKVLGRFKPEDYAPVDP